MSERKRKLCCCWGVIGWDGWMVSYVYSHGRGGGLVHTRAAIFPWDMGGSEVGSWETEGWSIREGKVWLVRMWGTRDPPGENLLVNLFRYLESLPRGGSSKGALLAMRAHAHVRIHLVTTEVHCTPTRMRGKIFTWGVLRGRSDYCQIGTTHFRGQLFRSWTISGTLSWSWLPHGITKTNIEQYTAWVEF